MQINGSIAESWNWIMDKLNNLNTHTHFYIVEQKNIAAKLTKTSSCSLVAKLN